MKEKVDGVSCNKLAACVFSFNANLANLAWGINPGASAKCHRLTFTVDGAALCVAVYDGECAPK